MTTLFRLDAKGGFVCGDTETGRTSYAYPTSPFANEAKKYPEKVARTMMKFENRSTRKCTRVDVRRINELQAIEQNSTYLPATRHRRVKTGDDGSRAGCVAKRTASK